MDILDPENRLLQTRVKESLQNARALEEEVARLTNINAQLSGENTDLTERNQILSVNVDNIYQRLQKLGQLRSQHKDLSSDIENIGRDQITTADRDVEIEGLRSELHAATEQIKTLQGQILTVKQTDSSLTVRDEDYFDNICQELYRHVNQWVQRFSEVSRTRACTLSSEIRDQELKVILKNTTLDGSDVDTYLADRVKRRDVLMSVVMNMIGERVFASYLFGMGRMQREVLQALERNFYQVGK
jgi:DNA repair exonuclease SbcCD ATPase subunit